MRVTNQRIGWTCLLLLMLGAGEAYGQSLQWRELTPQSGPQPEARRYVGAYVQSEGRFIIFGGSRAGLLNDVWELSRATSEAATPRVKTAVVIVNPSNQPAQASFSFTDSEGLFRGLKPFARTKPFTFLRNGSIFGRTGRARRRTSSSIILDND